MNIIFWTIIIYFLARVVRRHLKHFSEKTDRTLLIDDVRDIKADVVARTFDEGIDALKYDGPFTTLYLDHDLAEEDPRKTGYDIMCFLEENERYLPNQIVVVSANPVGRQKMQVVIDRLYNGGNR